MEKVYIKNKQGDKVLPVTHVSAVLDDQGNDVGSIIGTFEDEVRGLVDTPHQNYVTVSATSSTTSATSVLPASGQSADTIYRVANWDGSTNSGAGSFDVTKYSEYAWDDVSTPAKYVFLCVKSQIDQVFDITVYNNNTKYADLAAALGNGGANIPESLRRGGMSVKYVQSYDNKYAQYRLMSNSFSTAVSNWQNMSKQSLVTILPSPASILPNIDTINFTLTIPALFLVITENARYETTTQVTIPLKEASSTSSAQKLICNVNTGEFYFKIWDYVTSSNEVVLGSVRIANSGTDIIGFSSANFSFDYTIDGIKATHAVDYGEVVEAYSDLVPYLIWDNHYRITANPNRQMHVGEGCEVSISMTQNSPYQFAVRILDVDGNPLYDSSWQYNLTKEVTYTSAYRIEVWFRDKDNSLLNNNTINDIGQYIDSISITGYIRVNDDAVSLKLFTRNKVNLDTTFNNLKQFSRYITGLSGVSQDDIKGALMFEPGGINNESGQDHNFQYWRIRSHVKKFPFPIRVKHNVGYAFKVFYFDDENLTNPQPQEWQDNASIVQTFDIPANQYFRILAVWLNHETQDYDIADIVSSDVYNGIMVFNQNIAGKRCYDLKPIISTYNELIPYLKWDGATRIINNGAGVTVYKKGEVSITMTDNSPYQFAIRILDVDGNMLYDSSWKNSFTKEITEENVRYIQIWFRDENNAQLNANTIQDIGQYVSQIHIDSLVLVDNGCIPSEDLVYNMILKSKNSLTKEILRPVISVCHQGYSITSRYYGDSRISSYKATAKYGFDWAETDIKFSLDNVPVCCHDASFTDSVSGEVVVIAEHTFTELETYNYYGEKIASFDDVIKTCKLQGLHLVIDHVGYINTDNRWSIIFDIIRKYNMGDKIAWSAGASQSDVNKILSFYSHSHILVTCGAITQTQISFANSIKTEYNKVSIFCNYSENTVNDIINCNSQLLNGVTNWVWTIDDAAIYKEYMPFVEAIVSNKISSPMINVDE